MLRSGGKVSSVGILIGEELEIDSAISVVISIVQRKVVSYYGLPTQARRGGLLYFGVLTWLGNICHYQQQPLFHAHRDAIVTSRKTFVGRSNRTLEPIRSVRRRRYRLGSHVR